MPRNHHELLAQQEKVGVAPLDLYSLRHLGVLLGKTWPELVQLAQTAGRYYDPFTKGKGTRPFCRKTKPSKLRLIDNPLEPLKGIQSRILHSLLQRIQLPEHLLGGTAGRSIRDNVALHIGNRALVTLDIKSFFPRVRPRHVYLVWRHVLNCSPEIAAVLTKLTTYRDRLPQGAPTSTALANLVLASIDSEIRRECLARGIRYSTWVDDLAFSGDDPKVVIPVVVDTLMRAGFSVSHRKMKIMQPGARKLLNGIVLGKNASLRKSYLAQIRAGIHNLESGLVKRHEKLRYVKSLEGRIRYAALFNPNEARLLLNTLGLASRA